MLTEYLSFGERNGHEWVAQHVEELVANDWRVVMFCCKVIDFNATLMYALDSMQETLAST